MAGQTQATKPMKSSWLWLMAINAYTFMVYMRLTRLTALLCVLPFGDDVRLLGKPNPPGPLNTTQLSCSILKAGICAKNRLVPSPYNFQTQAKRSYYTLPCCWQDSTPVESTAQPVCSDLSHLASSRKYLSIWSSPHLVWDLSPWHNASEGLWSCTKLKKQTQQAKRPN